MATALSHSFLDAENSVTRAPGASLHKGTKTFGPQQQSTVPVGVVGQAAVKSFPTKASQPRRSLTDISNSVGGRSGGGGGGSDKASAPAKKSAQGAPPILAPMLLDAIDEDSSTPFITRGWDVERQNGRADPLPDFVDFELDAALNKCLRTLRQPRESVKLDAFPVLDFHALNSMPPRPRDDLPLDREPLPDIIAFDTEGF